MTIRVINSGEKKGKRSTRILERIESSGNNFYLTPVCELMAIKCNGLICKKIAMKGIEHIMRAFFALDLPKNHKSKYPETYEIINFLQSFGWDLLNVNNLQREDIEGIILPRKKKHEEEEDLKRRNGIPETQNTQEESIPETQNTQEDQTDNESINRVNKENELAYIKKYLELSTVIFDEMPEVVDAEKKYVIYLGYINDKKTIFVVTRMITSQIIFRLLQRELPLLQNSTERVLDKALFSSFKDGYLVDYNQSFDISIYERQHNHEIITGHVITNHKEKFRKENDRDIMIIMLFGLLSVITFISNGLIDNHYYSSNWKINLFVEVSSKLFPAATSTSLVSLLTLVLAYNRLKKNQLINWKVTLNNNFQPLQEKKAYQNNKRLFGFLYRQEKKQTKKTPMIFSESNDT